MKKLLLVFLVALLCLYSLPTFASEEDDVDPVRFVIEYACLFDWEASQEACAAYFEYGGFSIEKTAGLGVKGFFNVDETEISLYVLYLSGEPVSISLDVPSNMATQKKLTSYAEAIFGKMTREAQRKSNWGWNIGNGVSLSIGRSKNDKNVTALTIANFGEGIISAFPVTSGEFSESTLSVIAGAKAATEQKREEELSALPPFSFRNGIAWGVSKDEIISSEGRAPDEDDAGMIAFHNVKAGSLDAIVGFFLNDTEECYKAMYLLQEKHSTDNAYLNDYQYLKNSLTERYGNPTEDEQIWSQSLYKDDTDRWGFAVSIGDLSCYTTYETGDTTILLYMTGDNYEINITLIYESKHIEAATPEQDNSL